MEWGECIDNVGLSNEERLCSREAKALEERKESIPLDPNGLGDLPAPPNEPPDPTISIITIA